MSALLSQIGPIALIFIGAILSAGGAIWAGIQSDAQQQKIIQLNEHITSAVTGGDSYPLISPVFVARHGEQGDIKYLNLRHNGKYPVYDLVVQVTDVIKLKELSAKGGSYSINDYMWKFSVGTIGRGYEDNLMVVPKPDTTKMVFDYIFMARNGQFEQRAIYEKVKGVWYTAMKITKDGKLIHEYIDPSSPSQMQDELSKPFL